MPQELELKIQEIIPRTYNVKSFRLAVASGIDYQAGQFLCATLKKENSCKRYLSLSSSPTEKGYIEFTKKLTESDFSKALDAAKLGESLLIQYPFGKFTLDDPQAKVAFLSGGIGITPIRSICKYVADKKLGTDIILLYANRTLKDIVFKEDFEAMQLQNPKLKVVHVLSELVPGMKARFGRINSQMIKEELPDYTQRKFYICGPPGMVEAMKSIITAELSIGTGNIVTENFQGY